MARFVLFVLMLWFVCVPLNVALAHESRPLFIEFREIQSGVFDVWWKVPTTISRVNLPMVEGDGCFHQTQFEQSSFDDVILRRVVMDCPHGLQAVSIDYPGLVPPMSSLIRLEYMSGEVHSTYLLPGVMEWRVPEKMTALTVARDYTILGVEHIWIGLDHLLFLVCLVLIARTPRRVLITVTGFTLSHSVTLALAALGVVNVPVPPVEAIIALSIVFLAVEIARGRSDNLTWKYPVAVSVSFGFLHGFGFASVLGDIGLPQHEIVNALLFFNVGVEIGQIVFVLAIMGLLYGLSRLNVDVEARRFERPVAYGVGIIAAYWMIERIAGFVL